MALKTNGHADEDKLVRQGGTKSDEVSPPCSPRDQTTVVRESTVVHESTFPHGACRAEGAGGLGSAILHPAEDKKCNREDCKEEGMVSGCGLYICRGYIAVHF